jgi:hypothetical protein
MTAYEGIIDDGGGDTFRLYVDTTDGSYVDIRREDETARTPLDVPDDIEHWRIDVRDDASPAVRKLSGDEWEPLFEAAEDPSRVTRLADRLVTYDNASNCPRPTSTTSFRACC